MFLLSIFMATVPCHSPMPRPVPCRKLKKNKNPCQTKTHAHHICIHRPLRKCTIDSSHVKRPSLRAIWNTQPCVLRQKWCATKLVVWLVCKEQGCINKLSAWRACKPKCDLPVNMASIETYVYMYNKSLMRPFSSSFSGKCNAFAFPGNAFPNWH